MANIAQLLQRDALALPKKLTPHFPLSTPTPLPDIPLGCEACLAANELTGLLKQRLIDLGFTRGTALRLVRKGPNGNLIAVAIRNTTIALRSDEARSLLVM